MARSAMSATVTIGVVRRVLRGVALAQVAAASAVVARTLWIAPVQAA